MSLMAMATQPAARGGPFTRADLERMPDDGRRYEIIDGVLIVSAAPDRMHQRAVGRLSPSPEEARLVVWELGGDGRCREVGKAVGDEAFTATAPFPVTVVPADLVR